MEVTYKEWWYKDKNDECKLKGIFIYSYLVSLQWIMGVSMIFY